MSSFHEHPIINMTWDNHQVTQVWKNNTPLCLVAFKDENGKETKARLDLGKKIFIDDTPVVRNDEKMDELISHINRYSPTTHYIF